MASSWSGLGRSKMVARSAILDSSALGDLPPVLERLTSERRVESYEGGELLCLTLVSPR